MSDHERIAVPEGYVLVPKEMTEAMLKAGMRGRLDSIENMGDVMATWNAILAAAERTAP